MQRVEISDRVSFSRIAQGFWRVTDWKLSTRELVEFVNGCLEREVNTFDTADIYGGGECEVQLGKALAQIDRKDYKIVSKGGICIGNGHSGNYYDTSYEHILDACRKSVQKLGCEYLDLYLIHREDPMIDLEETARALEKLKADGLILEAGVSNFDPFKFNALNQYMGGTLRMNQIEWNPCCYEHFHSGMMDLLQQSGIHPMIWSPLCGGRLFSGTEEIYVNARRVAKELAEKYDTEVSSLIYAWILKHPVKAIPLVGSGNLSRLDEAVGALELEISREDWFRIYAASGQQVIR